MTDIELHDPAAIAKALLTGEFTTLEDPEAAARAVIVRILASESVDDAFTDRETVSSDDYIGKPFRINGVSWWRSSKENGFPVFASIDATDLESGERVIVSSGSGSIMAQLLVLLRRDALPYDVVIRASDRPTAGGYTPLRLVKVSAAPAPA